MDVLTRAQALEAAGRHVVHMEIGEPDFTAPEPVVEAAVKALRDGLTAYTPALGIASLREAIAAYYRERSSVSLDASRVAVTPGASGALLLLLSLYAEPGERVPRSGSRLPRLPAFRARIRRNRAAACGRGGFAVPADSR